MTEKNQPEFQKNFWKIFCPHPRVGLYILVNKTPCKANPSLLKAKFGQIEAKFGQVGQITLLPRFFVPFLKNPFCFDAKWISKLKNGGLGHFLICNGQKWPKKGKNVGFGQIGQKNLSQDKNSIWQWFLS